MKVSIDLPEIDGFEYTGEYRKPVKGEWFLNVEHEPSESATDRGSPYPIIKKKSAYYHSFLINDRTYIDKKAVEDAMELIESHYNWPALSKAKIAALKELL